MEKINITFYQQDITVSVDKGTTLLEAVSGANITIKEDSLIASQDDNTIKAILEWNNYSFKGKIRAYSTFIKDELIYSLVNDVKIEKKSI